MLNYLFSQLTRSLGVFFRTIRAFFSRKLVSITARLRRLTSFSRNAMKVATGSLQAAATAMKKPTKRDDYVETERLFISKAFLIKLLLVLAALGLIFYFLVWPFILSHFMTVKFMWRTAAWPNGRDRSSSMPTRTRPCRSTPDGWRTVCSRVWARNMMKTA